MKKLAIVTSTRADYGLLFPLINELRKNESSELHVELIVTGTHLVDSFGKTISDIERDGVRIDRIVNIPVNSENRIDTVINQSKTLIEFARLFNTVKYDAVCLLGDRYEILMVAITAVEMNIPVIHLYGGDITEGAIDDCIRHSITKMSYLHFPTNELSRRRIIQLGESPDRVFNYGATGIDNIIHTKIMSKNEVLTNVGLNDCNYAICTYHPVTLEDCDIIKQITDFIEALSYFERYEFIITKSNSDFGGAIINRVLDEESEKRKNVHVFSSLGAQRYYSLMKYSEAVIGNSSSGIMEAPFFHVPTVNIGNRQRGRLQAESTINCNTDKESIINAIRCAFSDSYKKKCENVLSPYGGGDSAVLISKKIIEMIFSPVDLKKHFYDIDLINKV